MRLTTLSALSCSVLLACSGSDRGPRTGAAAITVRGWAGPAAGVSIVFHRPDGSAQELAVTDAAGKASAVITEGALVTVARFQPGTSNRYVLTTIAGVEPGDNLVLAEPVGSPLTGFGAVSFPGPVDGASSYRVDASCTAAFADEGYVSPLAMPVVSPACGASFDTVAIARAPGGALLAYATALGVPITGEAPSQSATVTLGPWQTEFGALDLDVTSVPAGGTFVYATLSPRRNGRTFFQSGSGDAADVETLGSASLALWYPPALATSARLFATVEYGPYPHDGTGWVVEADAPLAPRSLDLATILPPRLSGAALVAGEGGALVASWQQAAPDPSLDAIVVSTSWTGDDGEHLWTAVAAPATSFVFPALPPELSAFAPSAVAPPAGFGVTAYDVAGTDGYAAFKATRLGVLYDEPETESWSLRGTATSPRP